MTLYLVVLTFIDKSFIFFFLLPVLLLVGLLEFCCMSVVLSAGEALLAAVMFCLMVLKIFDFCLLYLARERVLVLSLDLRLVTGVLKMAYIGRWSEMEDLYVPAVTGVCVMVVMIMITSISVEVTGLLLHSYLVGVVMVVWRPASRRKSWNLRSILKRSRLISPTSETGVRGCLYWIWS